MTSPRELLLARLSDGEWHAAEELAAAGPEHGLDAWIRLLRLSGYAIDERSAERTLEYRLVRLEPG